jgi:hypothetical protein
MTERSEVIGQHRLFRHASADRSARPLRRAAKSAVREAFA